MLQFDITSFAFMAVYNSQEKSNFSPSRNEQRPSAKMLKKYLWIRRAYKPNNGFSSISLLLYFSYLLLLTSVININKRLYGILRMSVT